MTSRRIAFFYPRNIYTSHGLGIGLLRCLQDTEYLVTDCWHTEGKQSPWPSWTELQTYDGAIFSGPEHLFRPVLQAYPLWITERKFPVVGALHESVEREGMRLDVHRIRQMCDKIFCPAWQDQSYGFEFQPFDVDTQHFFPSTSRKTIDLAFMGTLYGPRERFMKMWYHCKGPEIKHVRATKEDAEGIDLPLSMRLYAEALSKIKMLIVPPPMSQLLVSKVTEALACGCACAVSSDTIPGQAFRHLFVGDMIKALIIRPTRTTQQVREFILEVNDFLASYSVKRSVPACTMIARANDLRQSARKFLNAIEDINKSSLAAALRSTQLCQ